jgi:hypothetical protein
MAVPRLPHHLAHDDEQEPQVIIPAAQAFVRAGCCVIPARSDGSKAPAVSWKTYISRLPTRDELNSWFTSDLKGFGVLCGKISGNLEMFEFEGRAVDDGTHAAFLDLAENSGLGELIDRIGAGYLEDTPGGGLHYVYRVDGTVPGNTKLARRPATPGELANDPDDKIKVLVETRGEGGFVIVAPSNGTTHPTGGAWTQLLGGPDTIATITAEEHEALHALAACFDQMPADQPAEPPQPSRHSGSGMASTDDLSPGDDYNQRADWNSILPGWTAVHTVGLTVYWRRAGKSKGVSATTGRNDGDNLYVFSTSTPFDAEKPYSKFAAYTTLNHGGDFSAAAKQLVRDGYGRRSQPRTSTAPPSQPAPDAKTEYETFWSQREVLKVIHGYARSRGAAPWAVLGEVFVQISTAKDWRIKLPAIVGGEVPLNLFVALVGPSGGGKGIAQRAGRAAIIIQGCGKATMLPIGSGQAMAHAFMAPAKPVKKSGDPDPFADDNTPPPPVQHTWNVIFDVPEISTLGGMADMTGSQLNGEMCKGFFGETLGGFYVDTAKRVPVPEGQYAMGFIMGVQPKKADILLGSEDGGTPQRVLWLSVSNNGITRERPADPEPFVWQHPTIYAGANETMLVDVCPEVVAEVWEAHYQRASTSVDGDIASDLDGHIFLTRMKVAATFGLAEGRISVSKDDWRLAGIVMEHSLRVRNIVENVQRKMAVEKNVTSAKAAAVKQAVIEDSDAARKVGSASDWIRGKLAGHGWVTHSPLRQRCAARLRPYFDEAMDALVTTHIVESRPVSGRGQAGTEYRLAGDHG